ncbi:uncharacterized protein A4U43_C04F34610 [Asparagus officinalis]|uniref:Uncharacterized protein n=1 Tax=Asparagus officinalis TaxID=4686 RepID=A0A5P1F5R4_ASPOF|nr:uncharacterized protein A4U43_C04F34610 [Asparagus officinalis]
MLTTPTQYVPPSPSSSPPPSSSSPPRAPSSPSVRFPPTMEDVDGHNHRRGFVLGGIAARFSPSLLPSPSPQRLRRHINPAVTFGALSAADPLRRVRSSTGWLSSSRYTSFPPLEDRYGRHGNRILISKNCLFFNFYEMQLVFCPARSSVRPVGFSVASGVGVWHAVLLEVVLTFGLMYTVYATAIDRREGARDDRGCSPSILSSGESFWPGSLRWGPSDESGEGFWACASGLEVEAPLGLLGWAFCWCRARWACLRVHYDTAG